MYIVNVNQSYISVHHNFLADVKITPEPMPLSDSELPPRPERQKKKEKKDKSKTKQASDTVKSGEKDKQGSSSESSCS